MLTRLPAGPYSISISEDLSVRKTFYLLSLSLFSLAVVLCCALDGRAQNQNREKFVISAKAGGINAITGTASVITRGGGGWEQLMITDDLRSGDRVKTAVDGRVEILLNPGSYLRLGGNSEFELLDNSLANLEVRLWRGTAIVEATGADDLELNIGISTPHTRVAIVRQGLYRLHVVPEDATELIVRKGRVILSDSQTKVKGGNKIVFSATNTTVAKLTKEEKKQKDEVESWSKERAEALAKANRKITDRMLTSAFASFRDPWDPWRPYGRAYGFWFFNPNAGCYTFLPFFYGFGSPYGSSYTTSIYSPWGYIRNNGWANYPSTNGGTVSGGSGGGAAGGSSGGGGTYRPPAGGSNGGGGRPTPPAVIRPSGGEGGFGRGGGAARPMPEMPRKNMERLPNAP